MAERTFTAVLHKEEDIYVAECPEVGTVSQGASIEEAVDNLREATEAYGAEFPMADTPKALMTTFEAIVHA
ncbi:MAG: type II toxin-antitoxin system HicB family antitoxin [Candidatus Hydrogenedentes bacterium]|nr:type II toxin-antitoxin system HicB family antitoxin [Candidatus Hydrogenedentota bacterium]